MVNEYGINIGTFQQGHILALSMCKSSLISINSTMCWQLGFNRMDV